MRVKVRYKEGTWHDKLIVVNRTLGHLLLQSGAVKLNTQKHKLHSRAILMFFAVLHSPHN
jgi:ureidoglycolate hydrolase